MNGWDHAALLLVGHGSSHGNGGHAATKALAEVIAARKLFAEVQACFWKEPPFLSVDLAAAPLVLVAPHFAGKGLFTARLIPERLGLALGSRLTRLPDGRLAVYCDPAGCHPAVPDLLLRRAVSLCAGQGIDPARTSLLLVAHGSSRPGGASETPEQVAASVRARAIFAEVRTSYLEQAPEVARWPEWVSAPDVVVAPLLISEGMHAGQDLPPLFGLDTPSGGPMASHGHRVWLMGGLGGDEEVAGMILDLVGAAVAEARAESPDLSRLLPSAPPASMPAR